MPRLGLSTSTAAEEDGAETDSQAEVAAEAVSEADVAGGEDETAPLTVKGRRGSRLKLPPTSHESVSLLYDPLARLEFTVAMHEQE